MFGTFRNGKNGFIGFKHARSPTRPTPPAGGPGLLDAGAQPLGRPTRAARHWAGPPGLTGVGTTASGQGLRVSVMGGLAGRPRAQRFSGVSPLVRQFRRAQLGRSLGRPRGKGRGWAAPGPKGRKGKEKRILVFFLWNFLYHFL